MTKISFWSLFLILFLYFGYKIVLVFDASFLSDAMQESYWNIMLRAYKALQEG